MNPQPAQQHPGVPGIPGYLGPVHPAYQLASAPGMAPQPYATVYPNAPQMAPRSVAYVPEAGPKPIDVDWRKVGKTGARWTGKGLAALVGWFFFSDGRTVRNGMSKVARPGQSMGAYLERETDAIAGHPSASSGSGGRRQHWSGTADPRPSRGSSSSHNEPMPSYQPPPLPDYEQERMHREGAEHFARLNKQARQNSWKGY